MNKLLFLLLLLSNLATAAVRIEIPSSFNPVGSGARALGWGGSFIAVADDATAASWNPAALLKLRRAEVAVVYSHTRLIESNRYIEVPNANSTKTVNNGALNYLAFSIPCESEICGKNMIFSLNYQRLYDMSRTWDWDNTAIRDDETIRRSIDSQQSGGLYALGSAFGIQLTPDLFFGVTLNFWQDFINKNQWQQDYQDDYDKHDHLSGAEVLTNSQTHYNYRFKGFNYNLGLLWEILERDEQKLTLGLVYKSGFNADLAITNSGVFSVTHSQDADLNLAGSILPTIVEQKLKMPKSYGVGFAWQVCDKFTTSIDLYRTQWQDFVQTDAQGRKYSPLTGQRLTNDPIHNTTQIRMGAEYRYISQQYGNNYIIPLRAGLFVDPIASNTDKDNTYGLALGTGIAYKHWVFDIAYQYRFANDVGESSLQHLGFSQDINEHQVFGSVFYRF